MEWEQLIIAVLGGGGLTGIVVKLAQVLGEYRQGNVSREGTAITRWQDIAQHEQDRADSLAHELSWYRSNYPLLWAAYERLPPSEKERFPTVPPRPSVLPRGENDGP